MVDSEEEIDEELIPFAAQRQHEEVVINAPFVAESQLEDVVINAPFVAESQLEDVVINAPFVAESQLEDVVINAPFVTQPLAQTSGGSSGSEIDNLLTNFVSETVSAKQVSSLFLASGRNYDLASVCLIEYATLPSILNMLNNRFLELPKIKTCLDFDDLWSDMVALYKGRKFSENTQVKITINGSPAIDAGGVRRHVYTKVFQDFADNRVIKLFEGEDNYLRPVTSAEARSSGLLKILGRMVAHCICQEGIGFPFLSPTCYWYMVGGEEMAVEQVSTHDLPAGTALLIEQVHIN